MRIRTFLVMLFLCCFTLAAAAQVPLMPLQDLRPGMKGVGKTVISGDTIETFDVEIIGVNGSETSGQGVLVYLSGPLIEKTGGVAQGMSGSPVYVDGRLVGAVAYGRTFNDPHYCFLTPIGNMLKLLDLPAAPSKEWIPQGTSLMASGFSAQGLEYLQEKLGLAGLEAIPGGSGGQVSEKPLEAGSAVGASFMQGDLTLGALGTVTWVGDDGSVLAFGHPFLQRGQSNFYMNKAWVLGCIPNLQSSYKVGNMGEGIGTFTQDRASGIAGQQGTLPASIPTFVTVSDLDRGQNRFTRVQIIEDEQMMPLILDAAVFNTAVQAMDRKGGGTARIRFEISARDSQKKLLRIDRENMYYAGNNLIPLMNRELSEAAAILMQNKLEPVDVYGITVTAEITEDVQIAEIQQVSTRQKDVHPGEKISFNVEFKPYRGKNFSQQVDFVIPKDHPGGKLVLSIRSGGSMAWLQNLLRKQKEEGRPQKQKERKVTLGDYVKQVNEADKNNDLVIDISTGSGTNFDLEKMSEEMGLEGIIQGSPYKQKTTLDFIVDGEREITLNVVKN